MTYNTLITFIASLSFSLAVKITNERKKTRTQLGEKMKNCNVYNLQLREKGIMETMDFLEYDGWLMETVQRR